MVSLSAHGTHHRSTTLGKLGAYIYPLDLRVSDRELALAA
ncbi:MAG: hypothetical protein NVS3B5_16390 [Sphingomicrobium sp.]